MSRVGVSNLTFAEVLTDDENGITYDTPFTVPKSLIKVSVTPTVDSAELACDDQIVETDNQLSNHKVSINLKDLTPTIRAKVLGRTVVAGVVTSSKNDEAPYFCVMFKAKKSNGKYIYQKFLKTQFQEPKEDYETGGKGINYQTPTIEGINIPRIYDGQLNRTADEDEETYIAAIGDNWFTQGDVDSDTTPPTISSSVPTTGATAVAVTATYVWNFSEAILPSCVNASNFFLVKDSDGSVVAGPTPVLNAAKTQVTFTPTANLSAASGYTAICTKGVKDLSGNALAANSARKFTTA